MFYLLAVITPSFKIILFGFICFCSNAYAEIKETNKISISKHQNKRSIDFPTLFYPGPDNKFITLSPPPTLPDGGLTIFLNGHKETQLKNNQKETNSDSIPTKQRKTKFKLTNLHQDHRSPPIFKPQIQSNLIWNQNIFGTKVPIVENDQRPPPPPSSSVHESLEWQPQKVHSKPISTVLPPRQRNFSKIISGVPSLPLQLKSLDQIRSGPPPPPPPPEVPSSLNGQVQPRSFIQFSNIQVPTIHKGAISDQRHSSVVHVTNRGSNIKNPSNRIISQHHHHHHHHHHQSTFDRTYHGVSTIKPSINQHHEDENKKLIPPKTSFSCNHLAPGYYADLETRCKVFHICNHGRRHTFVCPSETLFNPQLSVCDWPQRVTCPPL